jgi:succinoglycan biosynthesis transport protein ExoP
MELHEYLNVLARRKMTVATVVVVALAVAIGATLLRPPTWSATATLRVEPGESLVGGSVQADDVAYLDRLVNTYSKFATGSDMRDRVAAELNLATPPVVSFTQIANTNLVRIGATTSRREQAAPAAHKIATLLIAQIEALANADVKAAEASFTHRTEQLETEKARAQTELDALRAAGSNPGRRLMLQERISGMDQRLAALRADHERFQSSREAGTRGVTLVAQAATPTAPDNRNLKLAIALALVVAGVAGPGMAFLRESLSRRFHTGEEVEAALDASVLAVVPSVGRGTGRALFDRRSLAEEAFRRLRTTLLLQTPGRRATLLVTSAQPGEGKSTVVANLGRSLAESGRSTLVIDADLRLPVLHRFYGTKNRRGLSDLLRSRANDDALPWSEVVYSTDVAGLSLLAAGPPVEDAPTLLGLASTSSLVEELEHNFDFVLFDSPAVLAVTDALALTPNVDGVLLVAGSRVSRDALRMAHQELVRAEARILGVVINGAQDRSMFPYAGYGGPYVARPPEPAADETQPRRRFRGVRST